MFPLIVIISLWTVVYMCSAQEGWKFTDRFYGFRYEIQMPVEGAEKFIDQARKFADEKKCFGWIQHYHKRSFVGEARCSKDSGKAFQKWFESQAEASSAALDVRVYEDTKIRLHFTSFKTLDEIRDTCFLDTPHKCQTISSTVVNPSTKGSEDGIAEEL